MSDSKFTEEVSCPVCDGTNYKVLYPSHYPEGLTLEKLLSFYRSSSDHMLVDQLVECNGCGLAYLNPRVRSDIILQSYSDAVDPTFVSQNEQRIQTFSRALARFCSRYQITPSQDRRVLDVGCAGAAFPKAASDLGFSVVGIEPSRWLADFGKREYGLDIRPGTLEDHAFPDNSFDVVTLWDVIEHLSDPLKALNQLQSVLKEDGYLVINYPDYASLARKAFGQRWPFFLSVHLFYFTPQTVTRLLDRAGFEVVAIDSFWQTLKLGYVFRRAEAYFKILGPLRRMVELTPFASVGCTYNLGQSMLVARKKKK